MYIGRHRYTPTDVPVVAVRHTTGFGRDFEYVAEVTERRDDGLVTVREFGHTREGAVTRARLRLRERLTASRRKVVGFA